MTDRASSAPIATLNARRRRRVRRMRLTVAPKASQTKQLGSAARKNSRAEGGRLRERAAGLGVQERARGAGAHEPRFRVDPLKRGRADVSHGIRGRRRVHVAGRRRDLPREPEQERGAGRLQDAERERMPEDEAAEAERHEEHHGAHPGRDAKKTRQAAHDPDLGTGGGQHDVAGSRRDGGHHGEERECGDLFGGRMLSPESRSGRGHSQGLTDAPQQTRSAGEGLERSCERTGGSWIAASEPTGGVELFAAWFSGEAYHTHRHDTYAICVTTGGVQVFDYRGAARTSTAGQVVALYPDEAHDGRAGTDEGFGYRIVYVDPARLALAVRAIVGRPAPLPFVREPVSISATLARAVDARIRRSARPARRRRADRGPRAGLARQRPRRAVVGRALTCRRGGDRRAASSSTRRRRGSCGRRSSRRSRA